MARLEINLLGSFQVSLDGKPVSGFDSDKVRGLLTYLAVEADQPHRREREGIDKSLGPGRNLGL